MIVIEHILVKNNLHSSENIKNLIYNIRGKQVIFDYDVAKLYGYETKRINEAVRRNKNRFPDRFCFQLTSKEFEEAKSHLATKNLKRRNYLPNVFTEQGIAMLSSILKNDLAVTVSISIIDAFVEMRKIIFSNNQIFGNLINLDFKLLEYDKKFDEVFKRLNNYNKNEFLYKIFYNGQIYDAYSLIVDIIESAKFKITIIDNYIDKSVLKILAKKKNNVKVTLITSNNCKLTKVDRVKFNAQYPSLKIKTTKIFHDRFIVIDDTDIYHCGASLKDLGKKCFAISKINDNSFIEKINK